MKKVTRITLLILCVILSVLIILPFAFKGKVRDIVQKQAEKHLNAKLTFDDLSLNLFTNFPKITASLEHFAIVGVDSFAHDTLAYAEKASLAIDLSSLMTDHGFQVKKVSLDNPRVLLKRLSTGESNWDIMKSDSSAEKETTEDTTAMRFAIEKVTLKNAHLVYDDRQSDMIATIDGWDGGFKGDLSADLTTIRTNFKIESLSYTFSGMPILSNAKLETELIFKADFKQYKFTFQTNKILLNAMELAFDGYIALPDSSIDFDIRANTEKVTFKQFLSLIPALYTKDFESIKTSGNLKFKFFMKGQMTDIDYPAFGLNLFIDHAMFQYPSLPQSVNDINVNLTISNPGGSLDKTLVDLPRFSFSMGGNPFDATAHLKTPVSDPAFSGSLAGVLNLGMVKDVYPLAKGTQLQGKITSHLSADGRLSELDKKQYDRFRAKGTIIVDDLQYQSSNMLHVSVKQAKMDFTPQYVNVSTFSMLLGKNDVQATGKLSNMMGWFLHDDVLSGFLSVTSNHLNINDFMTMDGETTAQQNTTPVTAFEIPKNLNLNLKASGKKILFNQLVMSNALTSMTVKDGRLTIKDLSANALGGTIGVNGFYEALHPDQPKVAFGLHLTQVSFAQTFTTFAFVQKIAPIFENIQGHYSMKMDLNTTLDKALNPDLKLLTGTGNLQSSGVKVSDVTVLNVLATTLKDESLRNLSAKDLNISFQISNGQVRTLPFTVRVGEMALNLSGTTGLDKTIDYVVRVDLPKNRSVAGITDLSGTITGTFSNPKLNLNAASLAKQAVATVADQLLMKATGSNATENRTRVKAEIDRKADRLSADAKAAGDKLIAEAETQGNLLIEKARNPLLKAAAKATATKMKEKAQKQADQFMADVEKKKEAMAAEAAAK
jgi:hypothetical protein